MTFHGCTDLVSKQSHVGNLGHVLTIVVSAVVDALRKSYIVDTGMERVLL